MISLKEYIHNGCTKKRVIRVKTENENEVLYDGTAGDVPEELLQANWLVKMTELDSKRTTLTVIKGGRFLI